MKLRCVSCQCSSERKNCLCLQKIVLDMLCMHACMCMKHKTNVTMNMELEYNSAEGGETCPWELLFLRFRTFTGSIFSGGHTTSQRTSYPARWLFALLPSWGRYRSLWTKSSRFRSSFFPTAVSLLNSTPRLQH